MTKIRKLIDGSFSWFAIFTDWRFSENYYMVFLIKILLLKLYSWIFADWRFSEYYYIGFLFFGFDGYSTNVRHAKNSK